MELDTLQSFLGWSLLINCVLYAISVVAVMTMRDWMGNLHAKMFGLDAAKVPSLLYGYIAIYKLLIITFNFVPWLAVVIMNSR